MSLVHRAVGMGADQLVPHVLGGRPPKAVLAGLEAAHGALWRTWWPHVRRTRGARELLESCRAAGLTVVLASSAGREELTAMRRVIGADRVIHDVADGRDVSASKPSPAVLHVALRKAKARPSEAVFVGDSIWDGLAAGAAGVAFVGLLCGGTSEAELRAAGATAVYADPGAAKADMQSWTPGQPSETRLDLYREAQRRDIRGRSKMSRSELAAALGRHMRQRLLRVGLESLGGHRLCGRRPRGVLCPVSAGATKSRPHR